MIKQIWQNYARHMKIGGAALCISALMAGAIFYYQEYQEKQEFIFPPIKSGQKINLLNLVGGFNQIACSAAPKIQGMLLRSRYGYNLIVDACDNGISLMHIDTNEWEPDVVQLLQLIAKPGMEVAVVGAHIGSKTLTIAQALDNKGHITALEANPNTFAFLEKNVKINRFNNITPVNIAAYNQTTEVALTPDTLGFFNTGLTRVDPAATDSKLSVQADTLDNILGYKSLNLLLLDVQGTELQVVEGAESIIDRSPHMIVIQRWAPANVASYSKPSDYLDFWRKRGFIFFGITNNGLQEIKDDVLLRHDLEYHLVTMHSSTAEMLQQKK